VEEEDNVDETEVSIREENIQQEEIKLHERKYSYNIEGNHHAIYNSL